MWTSHGKAARRSTTLRRHLLRFPYTAICRQKKTSTLDPSRAGSQSLRISLPKRFWPLIGAHVALLNASQIVCNRRCWVCSEGVTRPEPRVKARPVQWREHAWDVLTNPICAVHLVAGSTTSSIFTRTARTILARPLVMTSVERFSCQKLVKHVCIHIRAFCTDFLEASEASLRMPPVV